MLTRESVTPSYTDRFLSLMVALVAVLIALGVTIVMGVYMSPPAKAPPARTWASFVPIPSPIMFGSNNTSTGSLELNGTIIDYTTYPDIHDPNKPGLVTFTEPPITEVDTFTYMMFDISTDVVPYRYHVKGECLIADIQDHQHHLRTVVPCNGQPYIEAIDGMKMIQYDTDGDGKVDVTFKAAKAIK